MNTDTHRTELNRAYQRLWINMSESGNFPSLLEDYG